MSSAREGQVGIDFKIFESPNLISLTEMKPICMACKFPAKSKVMEEVVKLLLLLFDEGYRIQGSSSHGFSWFGQIGLLLNI